LILDVLFELGRQFVSMGLLHYENEIGPFNQLACHGIFGIVIQTGRGTLNAWMGRENMLSSGTAKAILTADEQYVSHTSK
jgi:hypothetical protein